MGIAILFGTMKVSTFKENGAMQRESAFPSLLIAKSNQLRGFLLQVTEHTTRKCFKKYIDLEKKKEIYWFIRISEMFRRVSFKDGLLRTPATFPCNSLYLALF